jgi:hypothetical protein
MVVSARVCEQIAEHLVMRCYCKTAGTGGKVFGWTVQSEKTFSADSLSPPPYFRCFARSPAE